MSDREYQLTTPTEQVIDLRSVNGTVRLTRDGVELDSFPDDGSVETYTLTGTSLKDMLHIQVEGSEVPSVDITFDQVAGDGWWLGYDGSGVVYDSEGEGEGEYEMDNSHVLTFENCG